VEQPQRPAKASDAVSSGIEGAWTTNPTKWDLGYFKLLFGLRVGIEEKPSRRQPVGAIDIKERRQLSIPQTFYPSQPI